ncbi:MAG: YggS family pyridoxal phosphate-dependent enzyme [Planctomycetes bacterium]|nr:YggS family pyridoxal phosphate-dependent enzyme [Planctomycetota bacterium]
MTSTATLRRRLSENLREIGKRIHEASQRARREDDITVVVVTKTAGMDVIRALVEGGTGPLAESRAQELARRAAMIEESIKRRSLLPPSNPQEVVAPAWHMVGHLQRNKVRQVLDWVDLIHSLDSLRLAEEIETQAARRSQKVRVLLQVNTADESGKSGVAVGAASHMAEQLRTLPHLELCGLMAMGPLDASEERLRSVFRRTRELFDEVRKSRHTGPSFDTLSMGMSNDFELAVECGATMVRLGRVVFEGIETTVDDSAKVPSAADTASQ